MPADSVLVIGGGPGGLRAAHAIADLGTRVVLVEQRDFLGGMPIAANYAGLTPYGEEAEPQMARMAELVTSNRLAEVRMSSEVVGFDGEAGSFRATVRGPGGEETIDVGAVVLATGFQHFDPGRETQMYGYYEFPDVIALQDLEAMLKEHNVVRPSNGERPQKICWIQCVGSRDRHIGNEYCSKVCCGISSKQAIEVRKLIPESKAFVFYIDMRMYGYWENQIYWPAQEQHHVQYVKGIITEILPKGDKLLVRGEDTTMGRPMEVLMDLVVLAVGMEPSVGTRTMAKLLGVTQNKYGFVEAPGAPLDPVTTNREGVYACGAALGPADLEDSVSSGANAANRAVACVRSKAVAVAG